MPETGFETWQGAGSPTNPWVITNLPFTHSADTSKSPHKNIKKFACSYQYENGPEYYYKIEVPTRTKIRTFVASGSGVDVDLHLTNSVSDSSCIKRNDIGFEATLEPNTTYYFIVDTYTKNETASGSPGKYLFGIHACDADDTHCGE